MRSRGPGWGGRGSAAGGAGVGELGVDTVGLELLHRSSLARHRVRGATGAYALLVELD